MAKRSNKKKKNSWRFLSYIILLISIFCLSLIIYIGVLPMKYLIYVGIFFLVINLIFIFVCRKKKPPKFAIILGFIYVIIISIISFYLLRTNNILDKMFVNYKTYNFSVIVNKDSNYNKLEDLDSEKIGYYADGKDITKKALDKLNKDSNANIVEYNDLNSLVNDLINEDISAVMLEDGYRAILNDSEEAITEISDFDNRTRIIYTFKIKEELNNSVNDIDITKQPFNIYISGIDTYGEISSVSRSDVNMVVTVNPITHQILLTSIPRDYYVNIPGMNNCKDKLTHAGLHGVDTSMATVEDLLDIDINYYFKVNFTSVIDIINSIGGVDVYSDYTFTSIDGYQYKAGWNHVDGNSGLSFVRERKSFADGDRQRVKNQQAMIEAILRECLKTSIISKYNNLLNSIDGSFITSMSSDRLISIIRMQLNNGGSWNITSNSLNGTNSYDYTCSYGRQKLYVMSPSANSISDATNLINRVLAGEVLESSYKEYSGNSSYVNKIEIAPPTPSNEEENEVDDSLDEDKGTKEEIIDEEDEQDDENIDDDTIEQDINDSNFDNSDNDGDGNNIRDDIVQEDISIDKSDN